MIPVTDKIYVGFNWNKKSSEKKEKPCQEYRVKVYILIFSFFEND